MLSGRNAYAGTGVPVAQSQEQIRALLQRSGARGVQFTEDWHAGRIGFRCVKVEKRQTAAGESVEIPLVVRMTHAVAARAVIIRDGVGSAVHREDVDHFIGGVP